MAQKAPEKIYLMKNLLGELLDGWDALPSENFISIEYTRTDAFIEKACEYWYQYNRDIVKKHGAKAVLGCSEFTVNVEDFKEYLKGE